MPAKLAGSVISMEQLLLPALILEWAASVLTMICGIGGGLYLGQWLWAQYPPRKRRR